MQYYDKCLKLDFYKKSGMEFQRWFVQLASHAYGSDFESVRPAGKDGDFKADGRRISTETIGGKHMSLKQSVIEVPTRLWSMIWGLLKWFVIAAKTGIKALARSYKENPGFLLLVAVFWCVWLATQRTIYAATSDGIRDGLLALITLNVIVFALVYATMQRAVVLSLRGDMNAGFFEWTVMMAIMSMLGALLGVIYLVWQPGRWMLGVTAALLVVAPGLVPVVAVQELMAQRRRTVRAVDKLLGERSASRSEEARISDDARFLTVRAAPTAFAKSLQPSLNPSSVGVDSA